MREHRFRIWDSMKKKMITESFENYRKYGFGIGLDGKAYKMDDDGGCGDPACCGGRDFYMTEIPHLEIMQFTGLYDKDKTPIYEDDVVKEYTKPGYVNHEELFKVIFCKDFCRYELTPNDFNTHKLTYYTRCKVVGNIHENPELLHKDLKS